jgi:DNA repair photolyase
MPMMMVDVNRQRLIGARLSLPDAVLLATHHATIYEGCEYGCVFCEGWANIQRPFNESVRMMGHLAETAQRELADIPAHELVALQGVSDPYQPAERQFRRTQTMLKVMARLQRPVALQTRSVAVAEDIPLLQYIHQQALALVVVSVASHARDVAEILEPKCAPTSERLTLVKQLRQAGIPVGVMVSPLVPYLNDTDYALRMLLEQIQAAGASFVHWEYVRIPHQRIQERLFGAVMRSNGFSAAYLRDLYANTSVIDGRYAQERNHTLAQLCDELHLPTHLPYEYFRGRLSLDHEIAMVLLHHADRDDWYGRFTLASQARTLAADVMRGTWQLGELQKHPCYALFQERIHR